MKEIDVSLIENGQCVNLLPYQIMWDPTGSVRVVDYLFYRYATLPGSFGEFIK